MNATAYLMKINLPPIFPEASTNFAIVVAMI